MTKNLLIPATCALAMALWSQAVAAGTLQSPMPATEESQVPSNAVLANPNRPSPSRDTDTELEEILAFCAMYAESGGLTLSACIANQDNTTP